jgi:5,10-methylene-tetrahydrofolate dehydrogenase/methenyl tetrahydrofolate cyclohydrolase
MKRVLLKGTIIDGNCMATSVLDRLRAIVAAKPVDIPPPKMTILLAGGNLASESYVRKKL